MRAVRGRRTQGQRLLESLPLRCASERRCGGDAIGAQGNIVATAPKANLVVVASRIYRPMYKEIDPYPSISLLRLPADCFSSPFGVALPCERKRGFQFCPYCHTFYRECSTHRGSDFHQSRIKDPKVFHEIDCLANILNNELFTYANKQILKRAHLRSSLDP